MMAESFARAEAATDGVGYIPIANGGPGARGANLDTPRSASPGPGSSPVPHLVEDQIGTNFVPFLIQFRLTQLKWTMYRNIAKGLPFTSRLKR
jgi:hypothetical protein